jgi:transcription termination factor Rho
MNKSNEVVIDATPPAEADVEKPKKRAAKKTAATTAKKARKTVKKSDDEPTPGDTSDKGSASAAPLEPAISPVEEKSEERAAPVPASEGVGGAAPREPSEPAMTVPQQPAGEPPGAVSAQPARTGGFGAERGYRGERPDHGGRGEHHGYRRDKRHRGRHDYRGDQGSPRRGGGFGESPSPEAPATAAGQGEAWSDDERGFQSDDGGPRDKHHDHRRDRHQRFQRPPRPDTGPTGPVEPGAGLLEISNKGFGFLRQRHRNFSQTPNDIFVTPEMVRRYGLRDGVYLEGDVRNGHRGPQMVELRKINGREPEQYKNLPIFEELTAINPNKRILLETTPERTTTRIIDMVAPIGKGQRGLIVAPPRTGKTTLLQHMAEAIAAKYADMHLIVLLVDERPEEVTEITRAIPEAEVFASSNDQDAKCHLRLAQIAIERAKRLVEAGEDVFIVLDSITRLARASNNALKGGGRTMSGGIDARAMELPRRLFAAARNTREAGSLTIVGTALVETNSKGDELIFQEFKGTGNMELVLDRKVAQQYVYPAVDIYKSGTRREELLLPAHQLEKINLIRRGLAGHKPVEAIERLLHFVRRHPNNAQMLLDIPKAAFIDS